MVTNVSLAPKTNIPFEPEQSTLSFYSSFYELCPDYDY